MNIGKLRYQLQILSYWAKESDEVRSTNKKKTYMR